MDLLRRAILFHQCPHIIYAIDGIQHIPSIYQSIQNSLQIEMLSNMGGCVDFIEPHGSHIHTDIE